MTQDSHIIRNEDIQYVVISKLLYDTIVIPLTEF